MLVLLLFRPKQQNAGPDIADSLHNRPDGRSMIAHLLVVDKFVGRISRVPPPTLIPVCHRYCRSNLPRSGTYFDCGSSCPYSPMISMPAFASRSCMSVLDSLAMDDS